MGYDGLMSSKKRRKGTLRPPSKTSSKTKIKAKSKSNLAKTLLQFIQGGRYSPSTFSEIMEKLHIPKDQSFLLKEALNELLKSKEVSIKNGRYDLPYKEGIKISGVIQVHVKGFGFLRNPDGPDVFVPRHLLGSAIDGDVVEVEMNPNPTPKGPEGRVLSVLKRGRSVIVLTVFEKRKKGYLAYAPSLGFEKAVLLFSKIALTPGDRIQAKIRVWKNEQGDIEAEMLEKIGSIEDPSIDTKVAALEFQIPIEFSKEAIDEANSLKKEIEKKDRVDWTEKETVTIDPETAKDFDDAISLEEDEKGHFFLAVHIADVAHYVKEGSFLDKEAFARANSTYFPGKCYPMLPEALSNDLCSLKPNVFRLTQSVFAEINPQGDIVDVSIQRSVIRSQKRFSYEEAMRVLEGKEKSPHEALLKRMVKLCLLLKKKRALRGSVDLSIPEDVILVDENGNPDKIYRVEYDVTHQMIEEFALLANEMVAKKLESLGKKLIYRIHEEPSKEGFQDFLRFARSLGLQVQEDPSREDLQKLFEKAKNLPSISQLFIYFIRSMRLAFYSTENLGHYGLALESYCHFTSPIRRYSDLIIQRLLFENISEKIDLDEIALKCSEKERVSFKAESSVILLKKLRLLKRFFSSDPNQNYQALITKVKPFTLFFQVSTFDLEGQLHISEIGSDFYEYNPEKMCFKGARGGKVFGVGQEITVRVESVNLLLMESRWSIVKKPKK